jgi:uncharacterized OsmC-like protein
MVDISETAAADVQVSDRIQTIFVATEYLSNYQSVSQVRDLPPVYNDEPVELGGKDSGPTPLEMTLCALNACTAMIINILRREMKFDVGGLRFETEGHHDVRRAEMKRTGKLFSEVEPIARHYHKVIQKAYIQTSESDERLEEMRAKVHKLCPLHALLEDAGVDFDFQWIRSA